MEELVSSLTVASYHRVLRRLRKYCDLESILDVGCGKGEFVWTALKEGYVIQGLELSREACDVARSLGLPVQQSSLYSGDFGSRQWSAITMFEVIEHVDRPMAMIQRATDLLMPGGVLYLTTPNYNSFDRLGLGSRWNVFHPEHITYFSTRGLARAIRKLEPRLRLVSVESNNISPLVLGGFLGKIKAPFRTPKFEESTANSDIFNSSFDLRSLSESTRLSRVAKRFVNHGLSMLGLGSTTIITAKKLKA